MQGLSEVIQGQKDFSTLKSEIANMKTPLFF